MSPESVVQYEDYSAIEAALKETARGHAFLTAYAQRVQQSQSIAILAMLSRLERVSDDLAARLGQLERARSSHPVPVGLPQRSPTPVEERPGSPNADDDLQAIIADLAHVGLHPEGRTNEMMQRIEAVATTLGDLRRKAARLTAHRGGPERQLGPSASLRGNTQAPALPGSGAQPVQPPGGADAGDEDVLNEIAKALGDNGPS